MVVDNVGGQCYAMLYVYLIIFGLRVSLGMVHSHWDCPFPLCSWRPFPESFKVLKYDIGLRPRRETSGNSILDHCQHIRHLHFRAVVSQHIGKATAASMSFLRWVAVSGPAESQSLRSAQGLYQDLLIRSRTESSAISDARQLSYRVLWRYLKCTCWVIGNSNLIRFFCGFHDFHF